MRKLLLLLLVFALPVAAQTINPNQIRPGTYQNGTYTFPGTLAPNTLNVTGAATFGGSMSLLEGINIQSSSVQQQAPNDTANGTVLNEMACYEFSGKVGLCSLTATNLAGLVTGGATGTTAGNAIFAASGRALGTFDGTATPGDCAVLSSTTYGYLHDTGQTCSGLVVGTVFLGCSGAGCTASVNLSLSLNSLSAATVTAGTSFWGGNAQVKTQPFAAFITPEWWGAVGDGSHDDTTALQDCFTTSGTLFGRCVLDPSVSYKFTSTLTIPTHIHIQGSGPINSSILKCEVNGDCLKIDSGPVQGVTLENFQVNLDSAFTSSVGLDATAVATLVNGVTQGGWWDSSVKYVSFVGCPNQCVKIYGGGGAGYTYNAPNQFLDFVHLSLSGTATASHAPLLDMKGQDDQITFIGGQANGDASYSANYSAIVNISNLTNGLNDAPVDVKFINFTMQNAQGGMNANFVRALSYDTGWVENASTPFTVQNTSSFTADGIHLANSGTTTAEFVFASTKGVVRNMDIAGTSNPAAIASCSSPSHIEFENTSRPLGSGTLLSTSSCATQQIATETTITPYADTAFVNTDNGATPITTINSYTAPGKTITLTASGSGYFSLASGGNINFTGIQSPYPVYGSVVLRMEDLGNAWVIENAPVQGTQYSDGSGDAYSYDGTLTASGTTYNGCRITSRYSGTSGLYWGSAVCNDGASGPALFVAQAAAPSSWTWTQINYSQTIAAGTAAMTTAAIAANSYSASGATITTTIGSISGVATTDRVTCSANAQPSITNAPLVRYCIPQAGGVLLVYFNPTAASITPTAETDNWAVVR